MVAEPFATPTTAQPSPGLPAGEGHFYSDGFRPGDFKYAWGVLEELLQRNPGWQLADGTVVLEDGTTPPDLRDRFIVAAGTAYAQGDTGGSAILAPHTHEFTQPDDHEVTQPDDHDALSHTANHTVTQPAAHTTHLQHADHGSGTAGEVQLATGPASALWVSYYNSAANSAAARSHSNNHAAHDHNHDSTAVAAHDDHDVSAHAGTDVSPHEGGEVGDIAEEDVESLPPYAALYLLVKVH